MGEKFNLMIAFVPRPKIKAQRKHREAMIGVILEILAPPARSPLQVQRFDSSQPQAKPIKVEWAQRGDILDKELSDTTCLTVYFETISGKGSSGLSFSRDGAIEFLDVFLDTADTANTPDLSETRAVAIFNWAASLSSRQIVMLGLELAQPECHGSFESLLRWSLDPQSKVRELIVGEAIEGAEAKGLLRIERAKLPIIYRRRMQA